MALQRMCGAFRSMIMPAVARTFELRPFMKPLLAVKDVVKSSDVEQTRSVIYHSHNKGERHSVKAAELRFFRLHWGGWIRARIARHKRLWKKPQSIRWWARQHLLLNRQESLMLERMITPDVKKPRYFVDDPFAPYHKRHDFDIVPRGKRKLSTSYAKLMYDY